MKKFITIFTVFLLATTTFYGQGNDRRSHEKITTAKISFITNELSFTPEQAEKFWPVYNGLKGDVYNLYKEKRELEKNIDYDNISEKEAKVIVDKIMAKNEEIDRKKANFLKELGKIITSKQLLKLNYAEHKFKKTLLERIKKER